MTPNYNDPPLGAIAYAAIGFLGLALLIAFGAAVYTLVPFPIW